MATLVPEFMAAQRLLATPQEVPVASAVTADMPTQTLVHFQRLQQPMLPLLDSAEMHADGCIYLAIHPSTSPAWYDTFAAIDTEPYVSARPRIFARDPRTYAQLIQQNDSESTWLNSGTPAFQGGAFPPWRGPAPRWLRLCVPRGAAPATWGPQVQAQIPMPTEPMQRSGSFCNFMTTSPATALGQGVPEWVAASNMPQIVTGRVSNGFISGEDLTFSHFPPPPGYWLGVREPINRGACQGATPSEMTLSMPAELVTARLQLCNDFEGHVRVDPQFRHLLAANNHLPGETRDPILSEGNFGRLQGKLVLETEQWLLPVGYRPEPGDLILVVGRWIVDCGHSDWHTELHPMDVIVSSYLMTGAPQEFMDTANRPPVTDMWLQLTGGRPATVTKVMGTGAWPGGRLEFDVWPPARPDAGAPLRWQREPGIQDQIRIVSETPRPADNPNHLHVVIEAPAINLTTGRFGQVSYSPRRLATAYLMWWEAPLPAGGRAPVVVPRLPALIQRLPFLGQIRPG